MDSSKKGIQPPSHDQYRPDHLGIYDCNSFGSGLYCNISNEGEAGRPPLGTGRNGWEVSLSDELMPQAPHGGPPEMILPPPQKTDLEKLFCHATEVKGDLESVINALAGIIGTTHPEHARLDNDLLATNSSTDSYPKGKTLTPLYGSQGGYLLPNNAAPSVNVENVLKIVRANKMKNERFQQQCDSSQSSESSKEKMANNLDNPLNTSFQGSSIQGGSRLLLSDPGHMERGDQSMAVMTNRRKHKARYYSNNAASPSMTPLDICVKRSKSIKDSNDNSDFMSMPDSSAVVGARNLRAPSENGHMWVDPMKPSLNACLSDSLEFFTRKNSEIPMAGTERSEPKYYSQPLNNCWSPIKDIANVLDESSCSSWSVLSHDQTRLPHKQCVIRSCCGQNTRKQTPSISVSDSEGSTEPPRQTPVKRIPRLPSLGTQLRSKEGQYELILVNQPEQHHRARYMTEGSRGAVKDRSGNGFPTVQLLGWKRPATLQIFVGSEDGRVKPHSFYQACKVSGKHILSCKERIFDGTGLIEIQLETKENQIIVLDCIGILKLRNVDVERRAGAQRVKLKSTMARLVFRVNLSHGDGFFTCLQVTSDAILCTQPVGSPEICKMSLCEGSCKGNMELFIIGKNIVKCCQVLFQDYSEHKGVVWQSEARIDVEYLHQSHLVCIVPPYCDENLRTPVTVQVVISCGGRLSEPRYFTYIPDKSSKLFNPLEPFEIEEWKMVNLSNFPIGNNHLTSDLSNINEDTHIMKSTGESYDQDYDKPNDPSFTNRLFPSANNAIGYDSICSTSKYRELRTTRTSMDWMPSTNTEDITIASIETPSLYDTMSNSLDSNIQNDFLLQYSSSENATMKPNQPELLNTLTKPNKK